MRGTASSDLPADRLLVADVDLLHELLRDRRAALDDLAGRRVDVGGAKDRSQVDARCGRRTAGPRSRRRRRARPRGSASRRTTTRSSPACSARDERPVGGVQERGLGELDRVLAQPRRSDGSVAGAKPRRRARTPREDARANRGARRAMRAELPTAAAVTTASIARPWDRRPLRPARRPRRRRARGRPRGQARRLGRPLRVKLGLDPTGADGHARLGGRAPQAPAVPGRRARRRPHRRRLHRPGRRPLAARPRHGRACRRRRSTATPSGSSISSG